MQYKLRITQLPTTKSLQKGKKSAVCVVLTEQLYSVNSGAKPRVYFWKICREMLSELSYLAPCLTSSLQDHSWKGHSIHSTSAASCPLSLPARLPVHAWHQARSHSFTRALRWSSDCWGRLQCPLQKCCASISNSASSATHLCDARTQLSKVFPDINVILSHYQVNHEKAMLWGKTCSSPCTTEVTQMGAEKGEL